MSARSLPCCLFSAPCDIFILWIVTRRLLLLYTISREDSFPSCLSCQAFSAFTRNPLALCKCWVDGWNTHVQTPEQGMGVFLCHSQARSYCLEQAGVPASSLRWPNSASSAGVASTAAFYVDARIQAQVLLPAERGSLPLSLLLGPFPYSLFAKFDNTHISVPLPKGVAQVALSLGHPGTRHGCSFSL